MDTPPHPAGHTPSRRHARADGGAIRTPHATNTPAPAATATSASLPAAQIDVHVHQQGDEYVNILNAAMRRRTWPDGFDLGEGNSSASLGVLEPGQDAADLGAGQQPDKGGFNCGSRQVFGGRYS